MYRFWWWLVDKTGLILKAPLNVDIELAGKCNLACVMCPYGTDSFTNQGMMKKTMALQVIDEARKIGVKSIKFNFRGEPGLSKNLESLVQYAQGFEDVFINTNMLAFSEKRLVKLANIGLTKIIISVDGSTKADYEKIRIGGSFEKLVKNIKIFNFYKKKTKVILQMVSDRPDEMLKQIPADEYRFVKVQDRGQGIGKNKGKRRRCPQPRQRLVVAWDGTIYGCCSNWDDEFPLGNIKTTTLLEAWRGDRMKELREISTKCESFPCKECQVGGSYK